MDALPPKIPQNLKPALQQLEAALTARRGELFLVGGCVRDALLGLPLNELDLEVFGLEAGEVEHLLTRAGFRAQWVGRSFGVFKLHPLPIDLGLPRQERKTGERHTDFEIEVDPGLSLEEAAARRDYTINAMYWSFHDKRLHDPHGGRRDLEERRLRPVGPRFLEDPLRVLRGMQFAGRFELAADEKTVEYAAKMNAAGLSRERIHGEWEKWLLKSVRPSAGLRFLEATGWIRDYPELSRLIGCPQEPAFHPEGDVWEHTLAAIDAFPALRTGDREEDLIVGFAILTHDFGKPATTEKVEGRIQSHGHEVEGLEPAGQFLEKIGAPIRLRDEILALVRHHMRPGQLYRDGSSERAIRRLAAEVGRIDRLLRVVEADSDGRPPLPSMGPEIRAWFEKKTRKLQVERNRPRAVLLGRHLIEAGLKPGPHFKEILNEAYEAQLDGEFEDLEGARSWLEKRIRPRPLS